jgi:hypothetical protein
MMTAGGSRLLGGGHVGLGRRRRGSPWVAPPTAAQLWMICREAIDAGAPASRSTPARAACVSDASTPRAVLARRRGRGHRRPEPPAPRPAHCPRTGPPAPCARRARTPRRGRIAGAELGGVGPAPCLRRPPPLRNGLPVAVRFEQHAVAAALAAAGEALGEDADAATAQGRSLDLRDVATHQHVARPRRGRRGTRG